MAELSAPQQNRLLGQLANMLRTTEGDIAAPEFLPRGLDVMGLMRQLMLPSAETVEKLSYGDPLFRMPMQSNIPITADREYLADVVGMAPMVPAASSGATRLTNEAADQLVRAITRNPEATAPAVLEAAGEMLPLSRMISPEVAARALPNTKAVKNDEPVMLYSGSQNEIQQFDDRSGIAFPAWFTDRPDVASAYAVDPTRAARGERSPTVYPSYLDLQNPLVLDAKGAKWNNIKVRDKDIADELEIDAPVSTTFLAYAARQKGYDGVIIKNVKDNPNAEVSGVSDVYVPFSPEQIRSATSDPQMAGLLDQPAQSVAANPLYQLTKEEFLGSPKIISPKSSADLKPRTLTTNVDAPKEPFLDGQYDIKMSEDGAAVLDGDKVIASYNFGKTLVVDPKYRKKGIAEELVYQWRSRYPNVAQADTRTKASQRVQEKVWERIQNEKFMAEGNL